MKIIHLINSLKKGGAEGALYRLSNFHKKKYKKNINIIIITLIGDGFYDFELKKKGIKIFNLNLNSKSNIFNFIKKILKLRKFIKEENPDIIQSWMYHSNFVTLFLGKKFYHKIFWNIRHGKLNIKITKISTIVISIICGIFSRIVPHKIIYCSKESIVFHEKNHFYTSIKTRLIYNGYSDRLYYPNNNFRKKFRKKNKIKNQDFIIGFAGRYAKQKNIPTLLDAFSIAVKNFDNIYLYMVGKNINFSNRELTEAVTNLKIEKKVFFLDEQKNLLEFYNGIDLLALTSTSESFPNVIAESMLCSTPVLSNNVGSAKKIIKNCGFITDDVNSKSITKNLNFILKLFKNKKKWIFLKKSCRIQIQKNFSIDKMAELYLKNWLL